MTDKELQKLGRRELLQLLLEQAKEAERLGKTLKETDEQLKQMEQSYERLRERLDHKDAQIHELRDALEAERAKPRAATIMEAGNLAEEALKVSGVLEAAQRAAEEYLRSVRQYYPMPAGTRVPPEPQLRQQPPQPRQEPARTSPPPQEPVWESQPRQEPAWAPPPPQEPAWEPPQSQEPTWAPSQPQELLWEPQPRQEPAWASPPSQEPAWEAPPLQEADWEPAAPEPAAEPFAYPPRSAPAQPQNKQQQRPHGLRKPRDNKKTLFFGWQHD